MPRVIGWSLFLPLFPPLAVLVIKVAADPVKELRAGFLRWDEDRVVDGDESHAALHELSELREALAVQERLIELPAIGAIAGAWLEAGADILHRDD